MAPCVVSILPGSVGQGLQDRAVYQTRSTRSRIIPRYSNVISLDLPGSRSGPARFGGRPRGGRRSGDRQEGDRLVRPRVGFERARAVPRSARRGRRRGPRVGQAVELDGELGVGERVLVVAGREGDLRDQHRAVVERDRHPVGDAGGIAGGQVGVLDDGRPRDEVEQGGVGQPLGGELGGRDLAVDQGDGRAVGQAVVGRLAGLGPPLLGVLADDLDGRAERGDLDRRGSATGRRSSAAARTPRRSPTGCGTRPGRT